MHDLLEDPELELIPAQLLRGGKAMEGYTLEDNHLLYQGRFFVPKTSKWILIVFQYFHDSMVGGHGGVLKTYQEWQVRFIGWAEYWYNASFHSSIKTTPFKALYGRDPPRLVFYGTGTSSSFEVDEYLQERDRILTELKGHLAISRFGFLLV
ncbi:putative mitochondrial protein [Tanacetum coccineum]